MSTFHDTREDLPGRPDDDKGAKPTPKAAVGFPSADYRPDVGGDLPPDIRRFNPGEDVPTNGFVLVAGARRQGKTEQVLEMLRAFHAQKRFTTYMLVSQTLSGYEDYIPANHSVRDMSQLPTIIDKQIDVAEYNAQQTEEKDMVHSSVCVILDDVIGDVSEIRKQSSILQALAVQGRHIHRDDKLKKNEFCVIFITQRLAGIVPPVIRNNCDLLISSRMSNRKDRQTVIEENLTLTSDRAGIQVSRDIFDKITTSKPYRFIAIANHIATRRGYGDYVMYADADPDSPACRLCGTTDDWRTKKKRIHF